jgi:plastocyanin
VNRAVFLACILVFASALLACTPSDPDYNRVVSPNSSAEVGPVQIAAVLETVEPEPVPLPVQAQPSPQQDESRPVESASQSVNSAALANEPVSAPSSSLNPEEPIREQSGPKVTPTKLAVLRGNVKILGRDLKPLDVQGSIVTLKRKDGRPIELSDAPIQSHDIGMKDKIYNPRYLSIRANEQVSFINQDEIKHNVFSSTGSNAFDLGTYGAGKQRSVVLKAEGVVKVYCNIHSEMATFIRVDTDGLSVVTEAASGAFEFDSLMPGQYLVNVWHVRGEQSLEVDLVEGDSKRILVEVDTSSFQSSTHANKFGKKYKKNTALFDDEFY